MQQHCSRPRCPFSPTIHVYKTQNSYVRITRVVEGKATCLASMPTTPPTTIFRSLHLLDSYTDTQPFPYPRSLLQHEHFTHYEFDMPMVKPHCTSMTTCCNMEIDNNYTTSSFIWTLLAMDNFMAEYCGLHGLVVYNTL